MYSLSLINAPFMSYYRKTNYIKNSKSITNNGESLYHILSPLSPLCAYRVPQRVSNNL